MHTYSYTTFIQLQKWSNFLVSLTFLFLIKQATRRPSHSQKPKDLTPIHSSPTQNYSFRPTCMESELPPSRSDIFELKMIFFKNASTSRYGNALHSYYLCTLFIRQALFSVYNQPSAFLISKILILGNTENINLKGKSPVTL